MSEKKNMSRTGIQPGTFKRLMAYLFSHYRAHLITVILCIVVTAVASVGQTIYIQKLIDECILPGVENGMASVWAHGVCLCTWRAGIPDLHPHHGNGNSGNFKKFPC